MAMMVRHKLPMAAGLVTVVVAALAEMLGQVGFITGGMLTVLPFEARFHHLLWPALGGLGARDRTYRGLLLRPDQAAVLASVARGGASGPLPYRQRRDARRRRRGRHAAAGFPRAPSLRASVASCLCYLVAWSLGPVEIYILLLLLHEPATWQIAVLVEVFGQLIERATFMIPAKLVSQEGGKALVMAMLGYPADVGFAVGLVAQIQRDGLGIFRPFEPDPSSAGRRARRPRDGRVAPRFENQQRARGTVAMKQTLAMFACLLTAAGFIAVSRAPEW